MNVPRTTNEIFVIQAPAGSHISRPDARRPIPRSRTTFPSGFDQPFLRPRRCSLSSFKTTNSLHKELCCEASRGCRCFYKIPRSRPSVPRPPKPSRCVLFLFMTVDIESCSRTSCSSLSISVIIGSIGYMINTSNNIMIIAKTISRLFWLVGIGTSFDVGDAVDLAVELCDDP